MCRMNEILSNLNQINGRRFALALLALAVGTLAETPTAAAGEARQSTALYTKPEANLENGIEGEIIRPRKPIKEVFASSSTDYKRLYKGKVVGPDKRRFVFQGLPIGRYDLVVLYDDRFYEGLTLDRRPDSTLTAESESSIKEIINSSTPFFNEKRIDRIKGTQDRHKARSVFQEVRTRTITFHSGERRNDIQIRSIKLGLLEDTGIGWALMETREIVRQEVEKRRASAHFLRHQHHPALKGIRTIGSVNNLGRINLLK